ncbi:hypothetical protein CY34DRAFT_663727 [Suillus luteus UH-Slu-Lm8-n1]|uniref:Uncharacterized protein n=1 Tax=Suillus luteus UH-Slu-Lm8-n1 TaxID=930992 RepID=A0A0D0A218_9AGAM|nr:hypothetical protein CY34DRAFT_663727 [Suillus luteus UH-Slu-Lm8-n1]
MNIASPPECASVPLQRVAMSRSLERDPNLTLSVSTPLLIITPCTFFLGCPSRVVSILKPFRYETCYRLHAFNCFLIPTWKILVLEVPQAYSESKLARSPPT